MLWLERSRKALSEGPFFGRDRQRPPATRGIPPLPHRQGHQMLGRAGFAMEGAHAAAVLSELLEVVRERTTEPFTWGGVPAQEKDTSRWGQASIWADTRPSALRTSRTGRASTMAQHAHRICGIQQRRAQTSRIAPCCLHTNGWLPPWCRPRAAWRLHRRGSPPPRAPDSAPATGQHTPADCSSKAAAEAEDSAAAKGAKGARPDPTHPSQK